MSEQSALSSLRSLLASSGLTSIPDDSLLTTILQLENGNVSRAADIVFEDQRAERRRSGADDLVPTSTSASAFGGSRTSFQDEQFASSSSSSSPLRAGTRMQAFEIDESGVEPLGAHRARRWPASTSGAAGGSGTGGAGRVGLTLWSYLAWPFSLAHQLLLFLARLFRLRALFPGAAGTGSGSGSASGPGSGSGSSGRRALALDPRAAAERYVRGLEEETGARVVGRSTAAGEIEAGPSSRTLDATASSPGAGVLVDFFLGGYSDALKVAKEEIKILMVVLTSAEHEDVPEFRRKTLTDPSLVHMLSQRDFIVWGGDVREREAYQVSSLLEATTYPFVAFISLQPARPSMHSSRSSSSSSPRLCVLSRLEGSPLRTTSAASLLAHVTDTLLPRTNSFLNRLREEKRRREMERLLKAEQDRAYEEASRRDAERVEKKRAEERVKAKKEEERKREAREAEKRLDKKKEWRQWARDNLVPPKPVNGDANTSTSADAIARLSFRLPDGRRLAREFRASDTLESVYAYIETCSLPPSSSSSSAASSSPPADYTHSYTFSLVLGYPRRTLGPEMLGEGGGQDKMRIGAVEGLVPSANLIVEGKVEMDGVGGVDESESESESEEEE